MRVDPQSFEARYRCAQDPWAFARSPYELEKYDTTVASLSSPHYRRCFEPACSIGVLTERLVSRAGTVVACDVSPAAIATAGARLAAFDNVELVAAAIPEWWPDDPFDLIVLSELGYYWDRAGWREILERVRRSLQPGGELMAVHWLGSSPDHILDGDVVHQELIECFGPSDLRIERRTQPAAEIGYVLDRWTRTSDA